MPGDERGGTGERPLGTVRDSGGNVLVVGNVPGGVHQATYRQLLGEADADTRQLLVLSGRDPGSVERYLPTGGRRDPEHLRIVEHDVPTRSAAADGGQSNGTTGVDDAVRTTVAGDDLAGLGATVSEQVDAFEAITGGLDPGDLRVGFDSLAAVVARHGDTDVFGFLHILTERLRRADAAAVFHLPVAADDRLVGMFGSLFDETVEVRIHDGATQVRWDGEWHALDSGN
jgi:hypothetical protein